MDRSFGTSFFLSDIFIQGEVLHYQGGSPVLFEHLFWFLGLEISLVDSLTAFILSHFKSFSNIPIVTSMP